MKFKKGQGMFEYVLLLAGILLIVVLAIVLLRGGIFQSARYDTKLSTCKASLTRVSTCYDINGNWASGAIVAQPESCKDTDKEFPSGVNDGGLSPYLDDGGDGVYLGGTNSSGTYDDSNDGDGNIKCGPKPE